MHKNFEDHLKETIVVLLKFTIWDNEKYRVIAYWALKDYILLNYENTLWELDSIIEAFIIGSVSENKEILEEWANSISFLITHKLVYLEADTKEKNRGVIDALMILTKSNSMFIRTRAFSTLSTLSTYASSNEQVLSRIVDDMQMENGQTSAQYLQFISNRLQILINNFRNKFYEKGIERKLDGLFTLISIAKEPNMKMFKEGSKRCMALTDTEEIGLNQVYFLHVFSALTNSKEEEILQDLITTLNKGNFCTVKFYSEHVYCRK